MKEKKMTIQCCVCGQIKDENGNYDGIKREIIRTGEISHGYCKEDFEKVMSEIRDRE
jgi:hypothetical protein